MILHEMSFQKFDGTLLVVALYICGKHRLYLWDQAAAGHKTNGIPYESVASQAQA